MQKSLQLAQKRAGAAEANMEAVKTQAKVPLCFCYLALASNTRHACVSPELSCAVLQGLENEYDRLLAEHDALKRRLSRFDPTFESTGSKKGS